MKLFFSELTFTFAIC